MRDHSQKHLSYQAREMLYVISLSFKVCIKYYRHSHTHHTIHRKRSAQYYAHLLIHCHDRSSKAYFIYEFVAKDV